MTNRLIGKILGAAIGIFLIMLACYGIAWAISGISGLLP